jgi:hypothetical protein
METDDFPGTDPNRKGGFIRGFFIALLIIVLAVLLLASLTAALTLPNHKQLDRLGGNRPDPAKTPEQSGLSGGGTVVVIPESALTEIASAQLAAIFDEYPNADYLGLDIRLGDETIDLLTGFRGTVSQISIRPKAVLEIRARIGTTNDGEISVTPESSRIGRLPLPVRRIFRIIRRNPEFDIQGVRLDVEQNRFLIDPDLWLSNLTPGMGIKSVRAVEGSLRIALEMPESLEDSLRNILLAASVNKDVLIRNLVKAMPEGNTAFPDSIIGLFSAIQDFETEITDEGKGASVSYLEGDVTALVPGRESYHPVDFGDRLPVGTRIRCGTDSYAELVLPGDHLIKVAENSELTIVETENTGTADTMLSILTGKARFFVSTLNKERNFRTTAGQAAMAVRGTDFVIVLAGKDTVTLAVLEGSVAVNNVTADSAAKTGEVIAGADQSVSVARGRVGTPEPISNRLRSEIDEKLGFRTSTEEKIDTQSRFGTLSRRSIVNIAVPHVMNAAAAWAALDTDTQWEVQYLVEDYLESNPGISRAVDEFFRVNGLEDRRGEFETLFE